MNIKNITIVILVLLIVAAFTWIIIGERKRQGEWEELFKNEQCIKLSYYSDYNDDTWISSTKSFPNSFYEYMQKEGWLLLPDEQMGAACCFVKDDSKVYICSEIHRYYVIWRKI